MRNDFLAHHGILGQKWGIRRYQNPDGTLTDAGRKRYGVGPDKELSDVNSARGIERRLNDVDKAKARNTRKMGKYISKINEKQWTGTRSKYAKKVSEAQEYIKMGNEETKKLLKKADELGYSVDEAYTRRLTSSGAEIIGRTLLASGIASAVSWPVAGKLALLPNWSTVAGTKFKLKKKDTTMEDLISDDVSKKQAALKNVGLLTEDNAEKESKRAKAAADLGLKALKKLGRYSFDDDDFVDLDDAREWFIYEDQTIGLATIADLVNSGKSKQEIKTIVNAAQDVADNVKGAVWEDGIFQLTESGYPEDFIDACYKIKSKEPKK